MPPFPPGTDWIGPEPGAVERICARGPLLVHFVDAAHLSSVRTLPYLTRLGRALPRPRADGDGRQLAPLPVHGRPRTSSRAALARLERRLSGRRRLRYEVWHAYGCEGWPSLFLWGRGGALRWFHFGEGEYEATEAAIREELRRRRPRPGAARAACAPTAQRCRRRARRGAQRRGLPGRLGLGAVAAGRGRPAARARLLGGRAPGRRWTGAASLRASLDAGPRWRSRSGAGRVRAGRSRAPRGAPPLAERHAGA